MDRSNPYQARRKQYWPEFEAFFSALPPPLFQQGVLLKNNLATFCAAGGQFEHLLCRERDHPLLHWHFWLLDDLACPNTPARAEVEQGLFLAMAFAFAAVYTRESILDPASNFDPGFTFLDHALARQSDFHLGQLFPAASPFWGRYHACWQEYALALLTTADPSTWLSRRPPSGRTGRRPPTAAPFESRRPPSGKIRAGHRPQTANYHAKRPITTPSVQLLRQASNYQSLAFTKISPAAVITYAERDDLWPQLESLLNRLNAALQLLREIANLRRDITQRRLTYPILKTLELAGLDSHRPLSPERILGALVLTGAVPKICGEALDWLAEGRDLAQTLNLPTFAHYVGVLETWLEEVQSLFSLKPQQPPLRQTPLFAPAVDTLPKVIEMAEGYLLADLTFRESWEIQRRGLFGVNEMTAKAFPMGLVAEILARRGHDMSGPINDIFQTLQASGFRYYNHPHLPPDTDDLGLLLRLYPYSPQPELHRAMLQTPLHWLEENIAESGHIPVWLTRFDAPDKMDVPGAALWGNRCAAVEANLLLGLLAFDAAAYGPLMESAARQWCQAWLRRGLDATHHYTPLYALWTALELAARLQNFVSAVIPSEARNLQGQPHSERNDWPNSLAHLTSALTNHLAVESQRAYLTPQDAAFLILACRSNPALFNPDWLTLLCKSQRYDGSWADEPLYGTPTRGELAAWYSSRTVTTAFCYHALKTSQDF